MKKIVLYLLVIAHIFSVANAQIDVQFSQNTMSVSGQYSEGDVLRVTDEDENLLYLHLLQDTSPFVTPGATSFALTIHLPDAQEDKTYNVFCGGTTPVFSQEYVYVSPSPTPINTPPPSGGSGGGGSGGSGGSSGGGGGGSLKVTDTLQFKATPSPTIAPSPTTTPSSVPTVSPSPSPTVEARTLYFSDLDEVEWAVKAIGALYEMGVVNGVGDGKFAPLDTLTREQFAKICVLAFELEDEQNTEFLFGDVDETHWSYPYVRTAVANGLFKGINELEFGIGQPLTNQDCAVILYRIVRELDIMLFEVQTGSELDIGDVATYAQESVEILHKAGVYGESPPQDSCTRATAATMTYKIWSNLYE